MGRRRTITPARGIAPPRGRRPSLPRSAHDSVREAAAWVLERTLAAQSPGDVFLQSALDRCDPLDHGLLRELVLGSLRWLRRLDQVIAAAANRSLERIDPGLRCPLRIAAYQLLFLDRQPAHAVVNEAVEHAHHVTHRGGASFVNAVLRRLARSPGLDQWPVKERDRVRRLAIELSHPDFLVERWLERYGEAETRALLLANNRPKPLHLLAFRDRGGRELLAEELIDEGLEVEPSDLAPQGLKVRAGNPLHTDAFERGELYVQDEASQLAALIPPPRPDERILDVAAAPGGKCFTLLSCEPGVRVVGLDLSLPRLLLVRANLSRLERSMPLVVADACAPVTGATFDRVVVDLPCSGTGTLRKHPELKWRLSAAEIERLANDGLAMLGGVADRVRPGGCLLGITCSLEQEENERLVERFLERRGDFDLLPLREMSVPPVGEPRVGPGFWRLLTAGDHDGFTVNALYRRR